MISKLFLFNRASSKMEAVCEFARNYINNVLNDDDYYESECRSFDLNDFERDTETNIETTCNITNRDIYIVEILEKMLEKDIIAVSNIRENYTDTLVADLVVTEYIVLKISVGFKRQNSTSTDYNWIVEIEPTESYVM